MVASFASPFILYHIGSPTSPVIFSTPSSHPTTLKKKLQPILKCTNNMTAASSSHSWVDFSHLSDSANSLMNGVVDLIETRLGSDDLVPCKTPPDVRYFQSSDGNSKGSVNIRSGAQGSKINYLLGSWLNCKLPFGVLNISTVMGMLNDDSDAPHIVFEFIQQSPETVLILLDLIPRKDVALETDYLKRFYEDTQLDVQRQTVGKLAQSTLYVSTSLYVRSISSPTAISFMVDCTTKDNPQGEEQQSMDQIIKESLQPVVQRVFEIWLEAISSSQKLTDIAEKELLVRRDKVIQEKAIEVDLTSNLPRLFGQDVTDRVVATIRNGW